MTNCRNYSYDIIRTIAIIFVVFIHSMAQIDEYSGNDSLILIARSVYGSIIYTGVPLFVMLSGALLISKEEPITTFYKKRFTRVLIPFLLWSLVVHGIHCLQEGVSINEFVKSYLYLTLTEGVHGIYWYIYLILGLYLITPILRHLFADRNPTIAFYTAILLYVISIFSFIVPDVWIINRFSFDNLLYVAYFVVGHVIVVHLSDNENIKNVTLLLLILSVVLGVILRLCPVQIRVIMPIVSTVTSISLFVTLFLSHKKIGARCLGGIEFLSSVSYGIYLSHIILISVFVKLAITKHIPLAIAPLVTVGMVIVSECVLMYILRRLKLGRYFM